VLHFNYHQKHIEIGIFIENFWNNNVSKDILWGIFDF
jgi:hypothetical protein